MAWIYLILAGLCEMFSVSLIHQFNKDKSWSSFLLLLAGFGASFLFLSLAMKQLPMGTAYAVWTGIGASGGALLGMFIYGESKDWRRIVFIFMIIGATIGLKLIST